MKNHPKKLWKLVFEDFGPKSNHALAWENGTPTLSNSLHNEY